MKKWRNGYVKAKIMKISVMKRNEKLKVINGNRIMKYQ
jgi:hypothetical protein